MTFQSGFPASISPDKRHWQRRFNTSAFAYQYGGQSFPGRFENAPGSTRSDLGTSRTFAADGGGVQGITTRVIQIGATTFSPTRPPLIEAVTADTGRMNVVQGLERDRKLPAMLMEQRITFNPKFGRIPTINDRKKLGAQLAGALTAALE